MPVASPSVRRTMQSASRAGQHGRLQSSPHPDEGLAQANPSQHNGGGGSYALLTNHRQPALPGAYLAGLGIRHRVCEPVHGAAHGGALAGQSSTFFAMWRAPSTVVCTMQGTPARRTSSATATMTSPATSTQARGQVEPCSSLASVCSAGNHSS